MWVIFFILGGIFFQNRYCRLYYIYVASQVNMSTLKIRHLVYQDVRKDVLKEPIDCT